MPSLLKLFIYFFRISVEKHEIGGEDNACEREQPTNHGFRDIACEGNGWKVVNLSVIPTSEVSLYLPLFQ